MHHNHPRFLGLLIITLVVAAASTLAPPISHASMMTGFYLVQTHPHFWYQQTTDGYQANHWTAKQFKSTYPDPSTIKDIEWAWSAPDGPNLVNGAPNPARFVYYDSSSVPNCTTDASCGTLTRQTTERWYKVSSTVAQVKYFGGAWQFQTAPSSADCASGAGAGVAWPNLDPIQVPPYAEPYDSVTKYTTGFCSYQGYIGVIREHPTDMAAFCTQYFSGYPSAYNICTAVPNQVDIIYQVYKFSDTRAGCEATIYASGYPQPGADLGRSVQIKNWFRNGELRWSQYVSVGAPIPNTADPGWDTWWKARCQPLFTTAENWVYTGLYKLTNSIYKDTGDNQPATVIQ